MRADGPMVKPARSGRLWTEDERRYLADNQGKPTSEVAAYLGRSAGAVESERQRRGIFRAPARKDSDEMRRRIGELWHEMPTAMIADRLEMKRSWVETVAARLRLGKNRANRRCSGIVPGGASGWPKVKGPPQASIAWAEARARALRAVGLPKDDWPMEVRLILGMAEEFQRRKQEEAAA